MPNSASTALESLKPDTSHEPKFEFICSESGDTSACDDASEEEAVQVFQNVFLAASENGFLCTKGGKLKHLWKCAIPGGVGSLTWTEKKTA
jgi:hypothetical protein